MTMTCSCGADNPEGTNFCRSCGARVSRGGDTIRMTTLTPAPDEPAPPPDDFELSYEQESSGSLAPGLRMFTRVTVVSALTCWVDFRGGASPLAWSVSFPVEAEVVRGLYGLVQHHAVLTREWRGPAAAPVGSGSHTVSVRANGVSVTTPQMPAGEEEAIVVDLLTTALKSLVPSKVTETIGLLYQQI